jgi:hypothetical protein
MKPILISSQQQNGRLRLSSSSSSSYHLIPSLLVPIISCLFVSLVVIPTKVASSSVLPYNYQQQHQSNSINRYLSFLFSTEEKEAEYWHDNDDDYKFTGFHHRKFPQQQQLQPQLRKVEQKEQQVQVHSNDSRRVATIDDSNSNNLVDLVPFDVRIALTQNDGIQIYEVSTIVTSWMNDAFAFHLEELGFTIDNGYATFQAVILLKRQDSSTSTTEDEYSDSKNGNRLRKLQQTKNRQQRQLQRERETESPAPIASISLSPAVSPIVQDDDDKVGTERDKPTSTNSSSNIGDSYIAKLKGGVYFVRKNNAAQLVPQKDVVMIQQLAFFNTSTLLEKLQSSAATGLGSSVVDVRVFLNTIPDDGSNGSETNGTNSSDGTDSSAVNTDSTGGSTKQLEKIIIAAISVAVSAFLFLLAAIYWAYRYDKKNRDAYLVNNTGTAASAVLGDDDPPQQKVTFDRTEAEDTNSPQQSLKESPPVKTIFQPRFPNDNGYPLEIGGAAMLGNAVYPESVMSDSIISDQRSLSDFGPILNNGNVASDDEGGHDYNMLNSPGGYQTNNSVIMHDDDVSASLSQYYLSGMGKIGSPVPSSTGVPKNEGVEPLGDGSVSNVITMATHRMTQQQQQHPSMTDLASVSSMESYGYSLDGTVPSVMSPSNNPYSRSGSGGYSNNKSLNTYVNQNSYTSRLERIGGLPVEPDLRHIENLTIDDIDVSSAIETVADDKISVFNRNMNMMAGITAASVNREDQEHQVTTGEFDSNYDNTVGYNNNTDSADEEEEDGTIGAENDLCTIDGSLTMPFK